jgi:hypothetical protein
MGKGSGDPQQHNTLDELSVQAPRLRCHLDTSVNELIGCYSTCIYHILALKRQCFHRHLDAMVTNVVTSGFERSNLSKEASKRVKSYWLLSFRKISLGGGEWITHLLALIWTLALDTHEWTDVAVAPWEWRFESGRKLNSFPGRFRPNDFRQTIS